MEKKEVRKMIWIASVATYMVTVACIMLVMAGSALLEYQNDKRRALELSAETDAKIEAALAEYDRAKGAQIARDQEAVEAYYESTVREVDSYVSWRLDEALRESNRIINDAINEAELIVSEARGTKGMAATE